MSIGSFVADKRIQSMDGDHFLAQSALALSSSLDCEQTLDTISRICVPTLADVALVNLKHPPGENEKHRKFPGDFSEGSPEQRASQLHVGHDVLRACDPNAKVFVPLLAHDVPIGTLALFMTSADRKFGDKAMRIIEAFATHAAIALDNACRFEQERRANRFKSEFLASMSHEVRTPMTAVLGFAELLAENETDPEKCEFLETIRSSGEHLLSVLNDILDLARLEAGRIEIACERVSVSRLLNDLQSLMHFQAAKKRIRFSVEYQGSIPAEIETDPKRLRQILINLLCNAIKFTHTGSVRVVVRLIDDYEAPKLAFDVIDTGIGLTADQQSRLFVPYSQADPSVQQKYGGTGLGLAISKQFAKMLQGDIHVLSEVGSGSKFTCTVAVGNIDRSEAIDTELAPAASVTLSQNYPAPVRTQWEQMDCRVLVVDDQRHVRFLVDRLLSSVGADVTTANDGVEAIEMVESGEAGHGPFDVVLLDMQMPRLDGYQTANRLRAMGFDRPIVALTAGAMESDKKRCLDHGCTAYLSKPIDSNQLIEMVQNLLIRRM